MSLSVTAAAATVATRNDIATRPGQAAPGAAQASPAEGPWSPARGPSGATGPADAAPGSGQGGSDGNASGGPSTSRMAPSALFEALVNSEAEGNKGQASAPRDRAEASKLSASFDSIDNDADGRISEAEVIAFEANRAEEMGGAMPPPPPMPTTPDREDSSSLYQVLVAQTEPAWQASSQQGVANRLQELQNLLKVVR